MNAPAVELAAVIDIGTTAIRLTVAEIHGRNVKVIDNLEQSVNLGESAFTKGRIQPKMIERCVSIIRQYQKVIAEYGIKDPNAIRAVATTAVREADNRAGFIDRVFVATGIDVHVSDEQETSRLIYNGLVSHLQREPNLAAAPVLVVDVGAGSTEVLFMKDQEVVVSHTFRLGSLRLRMLLQRYHAPVDHERDIMANQVNLMIGQLKHSVNRDDTDHIVLLGGDARFAASQIRPDWDQSSSLALPLDELQRYADQVLEVPVDTLAHRNKLSLPDAETLGPALLVMTYLAEAYGSATVTVLPATLREGLLTEIALRGEWSPRFKDQVIRAAMELGHKFGYEETHGTHVAGLSQVLFEALRPQHQLGERPLVLLQVAAILHEVGLFISNRAHHKHSYYLIINSDLFGLGDEELNLVAQIARYHRRATPSLDHGPYSALERSERIMVSKLSAILRLADCLERSHSQRIRDIECTVESGQLIIEVPNVYDFSLENLALKQKGGMMQDVYGLDVLLRTKA